MLKYVLCTSQRCYSVMILRKIKSSPQKLNGLLRVFFVLNRQGNLELLEVG
jgi:hypothetical protein